MLYPDQHGQATRANCNKPQALLARVRIIHERMIKAVTDKNRQLHSILAIAMLLGLLCWSATGQAKSYSDLMIIIDQDGIGYTAQLTIFADNGMIVSRIPTGRENLDTLFAGESSAVYQRAHEKSPDKLTVISGSVFTRFRHRFTPAENSRLESENSLLAPVLRTSLDEFNITMADTQSLIYRISWVLPANIELLDRGATNLSKDDSVGSWSRPDNAIVRFEQIGGAPANVWLEYRVHSHADQNQACLASVGPSEWCSPDTDNDGVPDYRDICVMEPSETTSTSGDALPDSQKPDDIVLVDEHQPGLRPGTTTAVTKRDSLGCEDDSKIILSAIQFESGETYLNAKARESLDIVATALQRLPEKLFLIASFTDNVGILENNQLLSENRAASIRHYLMLRGVSPNQVQSRGFGESQPVQDNNTATGRRNNRRVELQRLN